MPKYLSFLICSFILFLMNGRLIFSQNAVPYQYKNVQIVGGGFVDGIIFHPSAKNVRYCRTDMGGAYRWNDSSKKWDSMLDWIGFEDYNLMGVESIAVDPSDADKVYLSCGTYTSPGTPDGAILRSNDRGLTFKRTNVPFKMGGNENGRGNGERMAVDPKNGNILFLGTRLAGLWKSSDAAVTWEKVESFPDITEEPISPDLPAEQRRAMWWNRGAGIVFIVFDSLEKDNEKRSLVIYAGVSLMNRDNLFKSTDGGKSWLPVPGHPQLYRPNHAVLSKNGFLFISYGTNPGPARMINGGVWKLNTKTNEWTDITPDKPSEGKTFGYAAIAVDSNNPETIITSTFGRPGKAGGDEIFRSLNGGITWKPVFATGKQFDYTKAPYIEKTPVHWMFDIEINPFDSNHAIFTTGYGGHETYNLSDNDDDKPVSWSIMSTGIEETVALELLSPPKGAWLLSAIGDYCGFVHYNLDEPSLTGCYDNPHFGNTNGIACAWKKPEIIVRVGVKSNHLPGTNIGYSLNGGTIWQPVTNIPDPKSKLGHIAVSSNGKSWIWVPDRSAGFVTFNRGVSWEKCKGLPDNIRVIADKVDPSLFYGINLFEGKLYTSNDGGLSFVESALDLPNGLPVKNKFRGDTRGGQDRIYATPDKKGNLWIAAYDGLHHSNDMGETFTCLPDVKEIHGFGFGKAAVGENYPALYLVGIINNTWGIFQSVDAGKTWVRINDDQHQYGLLLHITGDPKKFGRVYIGTHGRGIIYGDPQIK